MVFSVNPCLDFRLRNVSGNSVASIALFASERRNSRLNAYEEIKRPRYNRKIYIFLSTLSLLILFDIL